MKGLEGWGQSSPRSCVLFILFSFIYSRENEVEEVKQEGPKEMTLDEWKAMQDKERTKVEFNIRKPNEGADSQWKKGYVLHKSKSEDVSVAVHDPATGTNT